MGKRIKVEELEPEGDPSVVLMTSLGLILLAFFIMLNQMASLDEARVHQAMDSLIGTFGLLQGYDLETVVIVKSEVVLRQVKQKEAYRQIITVLETDNSLADGIETTEDQEGRIIISFAPGLVFPLGGTHLSPRYYRTLDRLAQIIHELGYEARIEGHADGRRVSGGRHGNWYLSAARAANIYRFLHRSARLHPDTISAAGFSNTRPGQIDNAAQRRVEIVLIPKNGGL